MVDASRQQLYERINDALDALEDNPNQAMVRQRRFETALSSLAWTIRVHGSGIDYVILWSPIDEGTLVRYIGPDFA